MAAQSFCCRHGRSASRNASRSTLANGSGTFFFSLAAERQPHVLEAERKVEAGRLVFAVADGVAIAAIDRHVEQRRVDHGEEIRAVEAVGAHQCRGFAHRLDRRRHHQVSGDLGDVRHHRVVADPGMPLAQHLEQRLDLVDRGLLAGHHNGEFSGGGGIRAAPDAGRDIRHAARLVVGGQLLRHRDRSSRHVHVDGLCAFWRQAAVDEHRAHRVVVRQHRDADVAAKRVLGASQRRARLLFRARAGRPAPCRTDKRCGPP